MGNKEPLLPSALSSAAPSVAAFALDEVKLCCSFRDDLEYLAKIKIFLQDQLKYLEKKYIEHLVRISNNPFESSHDESYESVAELIHTMKSINHDIEDIRNEFNHLQEQQEQFGDSSCLQKVLSFFSLSNPIIIKVDLIQQMKIVRTELRRLKHFSSCAKGLPISGSQTASYENRSSEIFGRYKDLSRIMDILKQPNANDISIVPIFGPVGIGKTTIACLVYHDSWTKRTFNLRIWVSLSMGPVDIEGIGQEIISKAGRNIEGSMELKNALQYILNSQSCFIVLDGLCGSKGKIIELKQILMTGKGTRSKIIVTTHSEKVANTITTTKVYRLPALSEDHCSAIFQSAMRCQNLDCFEKYGQAIIGRCEGIPLVAKFLGSVINAGQNWEQIWITAKDEEMWKLEQEVNNAMPILQSFKQIYCNMSPGLRNCFLYCSIFTKGSDLDKEKLIRQWIALGLLESKHNTLPAKIVAELYIEDIKAMFFFGVADQHDAVATESSGAPREVLHMHTLAYNLARSVGRKDILVLSENEKMDKTVKYCNYRYGQFWTSSLKSIDRESWPLKTRALILKANETDLELVRKVISANRYLRVLDLRGCAIEKLPSCVFRLKHLRYLDISGSPISKISLPKNRFQKLETLDLSETKLKELPSCVSNLKMLSYLSLRGCLELLNLPSSFGMFGNLQYLDLSFCVGLRELPESFVNLMNIPFLDLAGCQDSIAHFGSVSHNSEASNSESAEQNRAGNTLTVQSSDSSNPVRHSDSVSAEISGGIPKEPETGDLSGEKNIARFDPVSNNLEASTSESAGQNTPENTPTVQSSDSYNPASHSDSLNDEISGGIPKEPETGDLTRGKSISDFRSTQHKNVSEAKQVYM